MLQIAGLYKATLWGLVGLVAGGQIGINSASRGAYCLARLTPGFMMAAMLFPRLQVPHATISSSVTSIDASFAVSSCLCPVCVCATYVCLTLSACYQVSCSLSATTRLRLCPAIRLSDRSETDLQPLQHCSCHVIMSPIQICSRLHW